MQSSPDQPSSGAWLGLPPDEERPVSRGARYRCIFLMLLYWAVLSAIPQGADRLAEIGTNLPLWMGALELTPSCWCRPSCSWRCEQAPNGGP